MWISSYLVNTFAVGVSLFNVSSLNSKLWTVGQCLDSIRLTNRTLQLHLCQSNKFQTKKKQKLVKWTVFDFHHNLSFHSWSPLKTMHTLATFEGIHYLAGQLLLLHFLLKPLKNRYFMSLLPNIFLSYVVTPKSYEFLFIFWYCWTVRPQKQISKKIHLDN